MLSLCNHHEMKRHLMWGVDFTIYSFFIDLVREFSSIVINRAYGKRDKFNH